MTQKSDSVVLKMVPKVSAQNQEPLWQLKPFSDTERQTVRPVTGNAKPEMLSHGIACIFRSSYVFYPIKNKKNTIRTC